MATTARAIASDSAAQVAHPKAKVSKARISNPCDGCTIRRVRCEAQRPCHECRKRGIACTNLRTRQKRGPKGPREETSRKVREFQKKFAEEFGPQSDNQQEEPHGSVEEGDLTQSSGHLGIERTLPIYSTSTEIAPSSVSAPSSTSQSLISTRSRHLPQETYTTYLELFRDRLQCIWPVIDYDDLIEKLRDDNNHESHAFAASICASTMGQLRLPENLSEQKRLLAQRFAQDARAIRDNFDYLEEISMSSLLTSYLLHIYYVNCGKTQTAGFYMRETITYVQMMQLDRSETYECMDPLERALNLRVYWLVLITERTYCAQFRIPVILPTIDKHPPLEDSRVRQDILQAFGSLVGLFACLRANITEVATVKSDEVFDLGRLMRYQTDLAADPRSPHFGETQSVDIFVTRQWIRLLIWEYTVRHFALPYQSDVPGYALSFPVPVARELLATLSTAQNDSIICHGYSLELKVSRVAELLLDIMSLSSLWRTTESMLVGAEDIVSSLSDVLLKVGGPSSPFHRQTKARLGDLMASHSSILRPQLMPPDEHDEEAHAGQAQAGSEYLVADLTPPDSSNAGISFQAPGVEWMFDAPVDPMALPSGIYGELSTDLSLDQYLNIHS